MKLLRLLLWGLLAGLMPSVCPAAMKSSIDQLINALIEVESGNNEKAVGDHGRSLGVLQIQMGVIQDVNRLYGCSYISADRLDRSKSREICRLYLSHYGRAYTAATQKQPTYEVYSRVWNGGPKGHTKTSTKAYWQRVQRAIERQSS